VAIDRLLNDEELVRRLGAAAQSRAHDLFSTAKIVPEYEALYRRVLSQR
jgi:glycosyltransferase involved in cell wall biosynthesis